MLNKIYTCTFTRSDGTEKEIEFNIPINIPAASEVDCTGLGEAANTSGTSFTATYSQGQFTGTFTIGKTYPIFTGYSILNDNPSFYSFEEETETTLTFRYTENIGSSSVQTKQKSVVYTIYYLAPNRATNVQTALNGLFIKASS